MKPILCCIALAFVCACSKTTTDTYAADGATQASTSPASGTPAAGTPSAPGPKKVATDQSNDKADLDLAAQIRRKLLDDAVLSTKSKNAVIVVENGHATLSGTVPSASEKERVGALAGRVVGDDHVDNQIEVKP